MQNKVYRIGFWSGLLAFTAAAAYVLVQALQVAGVLRFPLDERLIYGTSLCIVLPFLLAMLALHHTTAEEKRFWSHAALVLTILYAVFVTANYVVQLATVIPAKLKGAAGEIKVLDQTPHSLFWDFDALGYLFMGLAMLLAVPAFAKNEKGARLFFLANAAMTPLIAVVYFYPAFSTSLLFLAFPWGITAPGAMLMLALLFRRRLAGEKKKLAKVKKTPAQRFYEKYVSEGAVL